MAASDEQQSTQDVRAGTALKVFLLSSLQKSDRNDMPIEPTICTEVIRDALERSGYLMKSRVVRALADADFFVEPNVGHRPLHGVVRSIDLTAEAAGRINHPGTCVKTTFVLQTINNDYPVVLLTERPSTPNADFESYVKFGTSPVPCPFFDQFHIYDERSADWHNLFSEICALVKEQESGEFIASRSSNLYSSLLNASQYTEDEVTAFEEWVSESSEQYWRLFFWHPMIVVSGQLLTAKVTGCEAVQLQEVPLARLEFNWQDGDDRNTTIVEIVREDFLLERLESIREQDYAIEARIHEIKVGGKPGRA